ncbi:MAG: pyridoxamine kinase [Clostridia bacterium]|nr:pyridoxamine kinase [Clostridia bacterium]
MSSEKFNLPQINKNDQSRIAAIHDLCGYGNCSLAIVMPIVSCAGVDVLPIPTSLVSAQTNLSPFAFLDTTSFLPEYLSTWQELNIKVDGVYTGFLGSSEQISLIKDYFEKNPKAYRIIDPVMGDHGKAYPTYTEEMCEAMKELVPYADVLVPNTTEASILLGIDYPGDELSKEQTKEIVDALMDMGAKSVVLKGIRRGDAIYNAVGAKDMEYCEVSNPIHKTALHGTGDLFASALTAGLYSGHSLKDSADFAGNFVYDCIEYSVNLDGHLMRGVSFEPLMNKVIEFCNS